VTSLARVTFALIVSLATSLSAQQDSTATAKLKPVVVTVTRGSGKTVLGSPYAITIVEPDSSRPGQRQTAIDETLAMIPGVTSVSRNNPAQDSRISIRGFGARSAFGVRGVRVLRDGIPITLPDGQTPLDYISLESVGRIEVLRGAASALYGNASGGVIDLRTELPSSSPLSLEAKQWVGSNALSRTVLTGSGTSRSLNYIGDVAYSRSDGFRAHSAQRSTLGFGRAAVSSRGTNYSVEVMGLANPFAQNPGALTIDEMNSDNTMADAASVRRNAGKSVNHFQLSASANRLTRNAELSFSAYGGARSLDNPLTFAVVEVGRHTWGSSGTARSRNTLFGKENSTTIGFDAQWQNDLRKNFAVCADTIPLATPTASCPDIDSDRGVVTLDQRELVSSAGAYISDDVSLSDVISVTAGVRADRVHFEVRDHFIAQGNPDDSGDRTLSAVSPVAGIVARVAPLHSLYANISSAFETPTATELGNHEDGTAGINPDLDPQRSYTTEAGAKGWFGAAFRYDVSLFNTRVSDELVPFEIPGSNGRRYFRNAGRTTRRGAEVGAEATMQFMSLMASYNYSRFKFVDYTSGASDFAGNFIPGIPRHRLQSALRLSIRSGFIVAENEVTGRAYADDANTFEAPGYSVTSVRAGIGLSRAAWDLSVTGGIQNLFDRTYASSLAVNAARAKYFEPAPGRTFFIGLSATRKGIR
jgi:iron complex outermembrane receptor protein